MYLTARIFSIDALSGFKLTILFNLFFSKISENREYPAKLRSSDSKPSVLILCLISRSMNHFSSESILMISNDGA